MMLLLYSYMMLYGVRGVYDLNTPFNVTYTERRLIHSVRENVANTNIM